MRRSVLHVVGACIAFILILLINQQALKDLWIAWQTEEYSHGLIIPFIALLLASHLLAEKKPVVKPSWLGLTWLALAALLKLIAALSAFEMAGEFSLLFGIVAISLSFLGRAATWAMAPALFYLVFAIPLPHLLQANLSENLQLLSSTLGVWPLDLVGIPVYQEGNVIDLGGYKLQVVEACSGLRYLFPLLSFGYLVTFLLKDRMWKRVVILLSTIPITILLNSLRIAFIGFTVDQWGKSMAEGFLHDFEGWTVFLVCVGTLLAEAWMLKHIGNKGYFRFDYFGIPRGPYFGGYQSTNAPEITLLLGSAALAFVFVTGVIDRRDEIVPQHPPFASFPMQLGDWRGRQASIQSDVLAALKLSDYIMADYVEDRDPAPVNFYVAYYAQQRVGSATHSPSNCIPGGGWQIENSRVETVKTPSGESITFTRLLIRRGEDAQLVYYWFDERGRDLTETTTAKWYLIQDSITMNRTDGALVRLITPLLRHETEEAAEARLKAFIAPVLPQIRVFIPGSTTVNSVAGH